MGLFLERLIFGEAYLRGEIYFSKSIGLALQLEVNLPFLPCFTLYLRAIFQVQAPGGLYSERRFNGGFFALPVWGAYIWRGLYMEGLIFGILRYMGSAIRKRGFIMISNFVIVSINYTEMLS